MTVNEKETLARLLFDAARIEVESLSAMPDVELVHSEEYTKKINGIINGEKSKTVSIGKTARVLLAAAIVVAILITAVACVPAIREFVVRYIDDFVVKFTDGNYSVLVLNDKKAFFRNKIDDVYSMNVMPDGFVEVEPALLVSEYHMASQWIKGDENIVFAQSVLKPGSSWKFDGDTPYRKITVDGMDVFYREEYGYYDVLWVEDGYLFMITCSSDYKIDCVKQMITGVKIIK